MKGHRCSGWVYSSLFYVIMRIYSYPLLLNSRNCFAFMAVFGTRKAPKLSLFLASAVRREMLLAPATLDSGWAVPSPSPAHASNTVSIYSVSVG